MMDSSNKDTNNFCAKCKLAKKVNESNGFNKVVFDSKQQQQHQTPPDLNLNRESQAENFKQLQMHIQFAEKQLDGSKLATSFKNQNTKPEGDNQTALHKWAKRIPCLGIILSLLASITLGSAGMLVKMTKSVHGVQVSMFRALIQLIVYGALIICRDLPWLPADGERLAVSARAVLGGASITMSYFALKLIPLGDATTIRFSLPIWTLIISYMFLCEACNSIKVVAVVGSITGVVLIAKPDTCIHGIESFAQWLHLVNSSSLTSELNNESASIETEADQIVAGGQENDSGGLVGSIDAHRLLGSMLALSSSICLAMSFIALRLCKNTKPEITIAWLSFISVLFSTAVLLGINQFRLPNNLTDVIFIILNGLLGSIGQYFITSALKIEQSGVISLARTFDIVVAFTYSAVLLHEQITMTSVVGAILVSGGVIAVILPKWFCVEQEANVEPEDRQTDTDKNSSLANEPATIIGEQNNNNKKLVVNNSATSNNICKRTADN